MADASKFRIQAQPEYLTVSPGAQVSFFCNQTYSTLDAPEAPRERFQWFIVQDRATLDPGERAVITGPTQSLWEQTRWNKVGRHLVLCHVKFPDGGIHAYEHIQTVERVEALLQRELERVKREGTDSPATFLSGVERYVQLLKDIAKRFPIQSPSQRQQHEDEVAGYEAYAARLRQILKPTEGCVRLPLRAVHVARESQKRTTLRLFVSRLDGERSERWTLVDWTDPTDRTWTSQHEQRAMNAGDAVHVLLDSWGSGGNRYPAGTLRYTIPAGVAGQLAIEGHFDTDGTTFLDDVSDALGTIGLVAAGVGIVVGLIAPVPGSSVISAAIWTSIFASTGAAVINIGQRHEEGFGSWKDDAFDTLTIVGNLFAAGALWTKGATVVARGPGGAILRGCLIGQFATDGVQGVLMGVDQVHRFDSIMEDGSLLPGDRARKLMELFRSMAIAGTLTYLSMKGAAHDLANLNARRRGSSGNEPPPSPAQKLKRFSDPKAVIDTTNPPDPIESSTEDRSSTTKVHVEQKRLSAYTESPLEIFVREKGPWLQEVVTDDHILLEHADESGHGTWWFEAWNVDGVVSLNVNLRELDPVGPKVARSSRMKGRKMYALMIEHFERGGPIVAWKGTFVDSNLRKVHESMGEGLTPKEAVLTAWSAEFWKEWARRKGLQIHVTKALPHDFGCQFRVEFTYP